jgi:eukaryotic-like serine/threonine-protein kinase
LFNNGDSAAILGRFTKMQPIAPPSTHNALVSPALDAIVSKALENDLGNRYSSAREMADAIEANLQIASTSAVGRWLQSIVHEDLDKHSALIAEIESGSTVSARPPKDDAPSARKILASLSGHSNADAVTKTFVPALDAAGDPASQSLISMTRSPSLHEVKAGRRKRVVSISAAAAGCLALVITIAVWPRSSAQLAPPAGAPSLALAAPAPPATALAAEPAIPVVPISSLGVQTDPASAQAASTKAASRPAAAHAGGGCSPPYTVDSRGIRHMKLACLH